MSTVVSGTVPANEFVLSHTLESHPDLMFEVEQIVTSGDQSVMPILCVHGATSADLEATLEEDRTVDDVWALGDFEDHCLFRMEWIDHIDLIVQMLTNAEATILDAVGRGDRWKLRILYPERSQFSETHDFCEEHGITFQVDSLRELEGESAGRYGMTNKQLEVLLTAAKRGYFDVPRNATLAEIADELDITHQAASERLRRAESALVDEALFTDLVQEEFEAPL